MAVIPAKAPAKPVGLELKVRADKSLEIRWQADGSNGGFHVEIRYFDFEGPGIEADHFIELEVVNKCAVKLAHPEELPFNKAWVVKVAVKASENDLLSDAVEKQVAWDDELSEDETKTDLAERVSHFQKNDLEPFAQAKGIPKILVVAAQHHGKSSHVNHLFRCFKCDLNLNDQMDVAPAGKEEKTMSMKSLELPVDSSHMVLVDTPAFPSMNDEMQQKLKVLLSNGVEDGVRRQDLVAGKQHSLRKPPHGAIIVVSLCHWRDQQEEMQVYLQKMAEAFKNASSGQVAFPYVVAVTFRDEFLKDCQKEIPREELKMQLLALRMQHWRTTCTPSPTTSQVLWEVLATTRRPLIFSPNCSPKRVGRTLHHLSKSFLHLWNHRQHGMSALSFSVCFLQPCAASWNSHELRARDDLKHQLSWSNQLQNYDSTSFHFTSRFRFSRNAEESLFKQGQLGP